MPEATDRTVSRRQTRAMMLAAWPAATLAAGIAAWLAGQADAAIWIWGAGVLPILAALIWQVWVSLRRGEVGLDIVALLSMTGALLLGETLAGNVVALMYAGGELLESYAAGRARREMAALLARAPKTAMKYAGDALVEVPTETIAPGDRLLVRNGDVVAADGTVAGDGALLDQSALTGEALTVRRHSGEAIPSGSVNAAGAFDMIATRRAADSAYGGIVRLVEAAQAAKAPMVRLADRYAIWFLLVTVVIAGAAWIATGDPIRALAVLVVATPCPLILAVPVAIASGMSLAARRGVLVKGGGVLEKLAGVTAVVIDKTGTVTDGQASVVAILPAAGFSEDDILTAAASLDQASNHVIAEAIVSAARRRGLTLMSPFDVREVPGEGVEGSVGGRWAVVGAPAFVRQRAPAGTLFATSETAQAGNIIVAVGIDGAPAGMLVLADALRSEARSTIDAFRTRGIRRIVLASGDSAGIVEPIGQALGVDQVMSALTPGAKVDAVVAERSNGLTMMIGDGVNDAPALAASDVGVAMGARGAAPSSEAADAVLLVDRLDRIVEAIDIARQSRRIALQSVYVGIGLSLAAMVVAAFGYLPPVAGALLQEVIDVAVILNALRALRPVPTTGAGG